MIVSRSNSAAENGGTLLVFSTPSMCALMESAAASSVNKLLDNGLLLLSKQVFFARGNLELIDTFYRYSFYVFVFWVIITAVRNVGNNHSKLS